jgi:hypothetical protein
MACPCFIPEAIHPAGLWPHRERLPLGEGFSGRCAANGGAPCSEESLQLHCNLGYADQGSAGCAYIPVERAFDAVRFQLTEEGSALRVRYVCERRHLPCSHGELCYDLAASTWTNAPEAALLALAEAAVLGWQLLRSRVRGLSSAPPRGAVAKIATVRAAAASNQESS